MLTSIDPGLSPSAWRPARTTFIDPVTDSSHRGAGSCHVRAGFWPHHAGVNFQMPPGARTEHARRLDVPGSHGLRCGGMGGALQALGPDRPLAIARRAEPARSWRSAGTCAERSCPHRYKAGRALARRRSRPATRENRLRYYSVELVRVGGDTRFARPSDPDRHIQ
jgi:hypothetical protein